MLQHSEAEVLAKLDELRERRAQVRAEEREILADIRKWLRIGGQLRTNGDPINRTVLIDHAGISRRIAYQMLDTLPHEDSTQPEMD